MSHRKEGATPLERLKSRYTHDDLKCLECGYVDETGEWKAVTNGSTILYRHVCPSCGEIRKRTFTLTK